MLKKNTYNILLTIVIIRLWFSIIQHERALSLLGQEVVDLDVKIEGIDDSSNSRLTDLEGEVSALKILLGVPTSKPNN